MLSRSAQPAEGAALACCPGAERDYVLLRDQGAIETVFGTPNAGVDLGLDLAGVGELADTVVRQAPRPADLSTVRVNLSTGIQFAALGAAALQAAEGEAVGTSLPAQLFTQLTHP